jgi:hypothetical protein
MNNLDPASSHALFFLFVLAIPVGAVSWAVTHEEIFREPREWCEKKSESCRKFFQRKFFYLFTCEYCFSHYVAVAFLFISRFKLLYSDWRGYLISGFSLVWMANLYMSLFGRLRLNIKRERVEIAVNETEKEVIEGEAESKSPTLNQQSGPTLKEQTSARPSSAPRIVARKS